ncbi:MAG: AMP-binding protein, partial [Tannerellaceae bacterium]
YVRKGNNHNNDIWGFAYNPTHMAGLQVFFQAFLNGNTLIRLFGQNKESILSLINRYKISHLSATPTFYRLLLPADQKLVSVKRITSGGEKFDDHACKQLSAIFPNAKITNVYASTEAGTLFATQGDIFSIKEEMKHLIKIENNLLYLHRSLMGESTAIELDGEWYNTGDLIEIISEFPFKFKFVSRQNEMINVGGYKVNPTEVEQAIRELSAVQDVFVYGKKNSVLGNVICSEVISSSSLLSEVYIREYLKTHLQEFKIPRIIKFVNSITTTRTGKIDRKK